MVLMYTPPLPTDMCDPTDHRIAGGCYHCCSACNYDKHFCHGCGEPLRHDGRNPDGSKHKIYPEDPSHA